MKFYAWQFIDKSLTTILIKFENNSIFPLNISNVWENIFKLRKFSAKDTTFNHVPCSVQ